MLYFKNYLYKNIGRRVRNFRKERMRGKTQEEFADLLQEVYITMDRYRLSLIENGKTEKKKNPYLLSDEQVNSLSKFMNCSPKELIFGDHEKRKSFVKLTLLTIIMNGDKHYRTNELINPIINTKLANDDLEEFLRLSMFHVKDKTLLHEIITSYSQHDHRNISSSSIKDIKKWYKENYSFFADPVQFRDINYLMNTFDEDIKIQSNLLIHLLFSNADFAQDFMLGLSNLSDFSEKYEKYAQELINNSGQYGGHVTDWKEVGYPIFVEAFNEMWERNGHKFMEYFEERLFNIDLESNGLKYLNDEFFHGIICDPKFENILYGILNNERYDLSTMTGHNIVQYYLQSLMIKVDGRQNDILHDSGYNIYKYNYDMTQLTQMYLKLKDGKDISTSNLLLYINNYLDIMSFNKN